MSTVKRKLIEVALPLEAINRESAREKSIRQGHPSTLHLWWARRPLAAARAILFAQLVDDPSAHPEKFPTEEAQAVERKRLFEIVEKLVVWENISDDALYQRAHEEIVKSTGGLPPVIVDLFAGGGSIPLEAQRLGLQSRASDLNPVAVLINKALIEIPPAWAGQAPVFPGAAHSRLGTWSGTAGLAEDVRRYGQWMRDEAKDRIGHHYPPTTLPGGSQARTIAWLWARTIPCANPACGIEMPLVKSFWLSKKRDHPTWLVPQVVGARVSFSLAAGKGRPSVDGTVTRTGATCVGCGASMPMKDIRRHAQEVGLGHLLMALVADTGRRRVYAVADEQHAAAARVTRPSDAPDQLVTTPSHDVDRLPMYGMPAWADAFTNRQLLAMVTLSDLVKEARRVVQEDARAAGMDPETASRYADAIALYLALASSRTADLNNSIVTWSNARDQARNLFARQAIPMAWDYVEVNPFGEAAGDLGVSVVTAGKVLDGLRPRASGIAVQANADEVTIPASAVVSTDPPYYDNIGYADLSDFFYVWLRRSLGDVYPDVMSTMLTPKAEELVATPHRFGGSKAKAEDHFERGFVRTFTRIRECQSSDIPITVFYAFKQSEDDEAGTASTGWETMLNGLIEAGLSVTATWPVRTERSGRTIGVGTNALASSIVLACRPRPLMAEAATRRSFITSLKAHLPNALRDLQQGSVAPVDLAQAAIGPGMAVFTRFAKVVEADGSDMSVRTALALINQVLDEVLSEQEGDFDSDTRFCVKWFTQFGWNEAGSGDADVLARATNTSVDGLVRGGVFKAVAGKARLLGPEDLTEGWDPETDDRVSDWEVAVRLAKALSEQGADVAGQLMAGAGQRRDLDTVKELAYLLFSIAEKRGWTQTAILFNGLGTAWNDLETVVRSGAGRPLAAQEPLNFDDEN